MNTKHLPKISKDSELIVAKVTIEQLQSEGLEFDDNYEILDSFETVGIPRYKNNDNYQLTASRSNGGNCYLELDYVLMSREDANENVHISQEISFGEENGKLQFFCPLDDDDWTWCKDLYLRADFPLFGSAKSLNIG